MWNRFHRTLDIPVLCVHEWVRVNIHAATRHDTCTKSVSEKATTSNDVNNLLRLYVAPPWSSVYCATGWWAADDNWSNVHFASVRIFFNLKIDIYLLFNFSWLSYAGGRWSSGGRTCGRTCDSCHGDDGHQLHWSFHRCVNRLPSPGNYHPHENHWHTLRTQTGDRRTDTIQPCNRPENHDLVFRSGSCSLSLAIHTVWCSKRHGRRVSLVAHRRKNNVSKS
jgi:hypothetical protein